MVEGGGSGDFWFPYMGSVVGRVISVCSWQLQAFGLP